MYILELNSLHRLIVDQYFLSNNKSRRKISEILKKNHFLILLNNGKKDNQLKKSIFDF